METEDNINIEFEEEKIEFRPDAKIGYDETKRLVMEIVEICECSENTVKSRLNYARKKIKEDVLELEKKGTKLYSISVLPFLYWLFREEFMACEVPASTSSAVAHATGKAIGKTIEQTTGSAGNVAKAGAQERGLGHLVTLERILKDTEKETSIPEETKSKLLEKIIKQIFNWVTNQNTIREQEN